MGLEELRLDTEYHTGAGDLVAGFYRPCLGHATRYDRAVGFFRSSVLQLIGTAFADFAARGGVARIICSPRLEEQDAAAVADGYESRDALATDLLRRELTDLLGHARTARAVDLLATLVRLRAIEMQVALRADSSGLYHEKLGIFTDEADNRVTFRGSSNESRSAWDPSQNHESFEVFCSWADSRESARCTRHQSYFEDLWSGSIAGLHVFPLPAAFHADLLEYSRHEIDEFVESSEPGAARRARAPMAHQRDAIQSWIDAGRRGILKHATGSGKTFTALTAAREHVLAGEPALILVPSQLLLEQWNREIREEFLDANILLCGAGHTRWKDRSRLRAFTSPNGSTERFAISTMQTAATPQFAAKLAQGSHLMVIADEVHQIGSPFCRNALLLSTGPRLGLSATPERYGDSEGTAALMGYFGGVVPPEVTLADAIAAGRLVGYRYHPARVDLTATETADWHVLSEQIAKLFAQRHSSNPSGARQDQQLSMLLIRRARIAKHASEKTALARRVIESHAAPGERWLVYCEDGGQLAEIRDALASSDLPVLEYHTGMSGDARKTLEEFRYYGGILLSIRCLDEGVDIPEISHALILASSQNPRQFIQRRGRVLRVAPHKHVAEIHDAIVVPPHDKTVRGLTPLVAAEVRRAMEFAAGAINYSAAFWLERALIDAGWDPAALIDVGDEADESEGARTDG